MNVLFILEKSFSHFFHPKIAYFPCSPNIEGVTNIIFVSETGEPIGKTNQLKLTEAQTVD